MILAVDAADDCNNREDVRTGRYVFGKINDKENPIYANGKKVQGSSDFLS